MPVPDQPQAIELAERLASACVSLYTEQTGHKRLNKKKYYVERAAYMRGLAKEAMTESLKKGCIKAAEEYERLAAEIDQRSENKADQE